MTDRFRDKLLPVTALLHGILASWYIDAYLLNAPFYCTLDLRAA